MKEFCDYFSESVIIGNVSKPLKVEDIVNENATTLFLVESPHETEVEKEHPLAGDSGISAIKFMLGKDDISLGEYAKSEDKSISIINVSNYPLQKTFKFKDSDSRYSELFKSFQTIRSNPSAKSRNNEFTKLVEEKIKEMFIFKMRKLRNERKLNNYQTIVLCGDFAKCYFELVKDMFKLNLPLLEVPHPSRNQWYKYWKTRDELQKLKDIFNKETDGDCHE
jgi:hypothetical protein